MLRIDLRWFLIGACLVLIHCKRPDFARYEFSHPSMGSLFNVIVYSDDSIRLAEVVDQAFSELDSLNLIMSDYIPHSELMRLSRTSGNNEYIPISEELFGILKQSEEWYKWSEGTFDVTIGPYSQLWRRARRQGVLPTKERIEKASHSVGFDYVVIDPDRGVLLTRENMQLDLGGIAKGYAVDHIYDKLADHGFTMCLVDGAGDLRVGAAPPISQGWEIKIQNFVDEDSTVYLTNRSVATSGDYYRSIEIDGKKYSHIIDPFTGYGISKARSVTVIAPDCTTADVLASVFSVAGPKKNVLNEKLPMNTQVLIYEREEEKTKRFLIK